MYAPISALSLREKGNRLIGYAAPAGGAAPCVLRLTADGLPIAAARATGFSLKAYDASLRLGWCGVELPGLATAAALGSLLEVRCGVTSKVVWQRVARTPIAAPAFRGARFSVFEIIALSRKADAASSLSQIEPFMRHHLVKFGVRSYVDATFQTFLGRPAELDVMRHYEGKPAETVITSVVNNVISSEEYKRSGFGFIPGPFNSSFRYDLEILG